MPPNPSFERTASPPLSSTLGRAEYLPCIALHSFYRLRRATKSPERVSRAARPSAVGSPMRVRCQWRSKVGTKKSPSVQVTAARTNRSSWLPVLRRSAHPRGRASSRLRIGGRTRCRHSSRLLASRCGVQGRFGKLLHRRAGVERALRAA